MDRELDRDRAGNARWVPVLSGITALALLTTGVGLAVAGESQHATGSDWSALSGAEQAAVSAAVGADQPAYAVHHDSTGTPAAVNQVQGIEATFTSAGVAMRTQHSRLGLNLAQLGRGANLLALPQVSPTISVNHVDYARGPVREWWVNGPAGLEQGFTIGARPAGGGELTLAIDVPGAEHTRLDPDGRGVELTAGNDRLAYRGLDAVDATGTHLPARIEPAGGRLLVHVADRGAVYPLTVDPLVQAAEFTSADGAAGDRFGFSVAMRGDTVVVGAPVAAVGSHPAQGAAYVFTRIPGSGGTVVQDAKLTASDGAAGDNFGVAVAVSDTTVVVGAPHAQVGSNVSQGAAYVFDRPARGWTSASGSTRTQQAKLVAAAGTPHAGFGYSVGISGPTVVVGAPGTTVGSAFQQGAAYVFRRPATGWTSSTAAPLTQRAELTAADGTRNSAFGFSVAIWNSTVVVGAPLSDVGAHTAQGAAYVFTDPVEGWASDTAQAELRASDGTNAAAFGWAVAIHDATVVVGAPFQTIGNAAGQGAGYVFTEPDTGWYSSTTTPLLQQAELAASDGSAGASFGASVAVSGPTVVIGAPTAGDGADALAGAGYLFRRPIDGWETPAGTPLHQQETFVGADTGGGDRFAFAVAVRGGAVIAGAPFKSVSAADGQGAAYDFDDSTGRGRPMRPGPHRPGTCQDVHGNDNTVDAYGDCVHVVGNGNRVIEPGPGSSVDGNGNTVVAPQGCVAVSGNGNRVLDPTHRTGDCSPGR